MNAINKNYPTVGEKGNYKKDPRFVRNIFSYLCLKMKCENKRLKEVNRLDEIINNRRKINTYKNYFILSGIISQILTLFFLLLLFRSLIKQKII